MKVCLKSKHLPSTHERGQAGMSVSFSPLGWNDHQALTENKMQTHFEGKHGLSHEMQHSPKGGNGEAPDGRRAGKAFGGAVRTGRLSLADE